MGVDYNELVTCLGATLSPESQKAAEARLDSLRDEAGLVSNLMHVLLSAQVDAAVRQSAAILMKNLILERWDGRLPETDKSDVRANLLAGLLSCPQGVRSQLCHSLSTILRHDFPERWPEFGHSVVQAVQASVQSGAQQDETTVAALLALYQLVKVYEFRRIKERGPLNAVMVPLLPVLVERVKVSLPDAQPHQAHVVHLVMKVFYAFLQFCIDQKVVNHAALLSVTEAAHALLATPVDKDVDHDEHQWKARKWALQLLRRLFERYGRPSSVQTEYKQLAAWYLPAVGVPSMEVTMRMLAAHCSGQTVISPRCIHLCLSYLDLAVPVGACWRQLRSHFSALLEHVLYPLLCHSADDEEEWRDDPAEYVRSKYDDNNQLLSPQQAARSLLYTAASRRRGILQDLIQFVFGLVGRTDVDPHRLDGALHALGAVGAVLLRRQKLRVEAEKFLSQVVVPLFASPVGFLRARACWTVKQFANLSPSDDELLGRIVQFLIQALVSDSELPVRCEAGLALSEVASRSATVKKHIVPHLRQIMIALMETVNKTVSDEIVNALEQMLCEFANESKPIAAELAAQLATTFCTIVENAARTASEHNDSNASAGNASLGATQLAMGPDPDSAMAGLGLLSALDTLADAAEESQETLLQLEPSIWQVVNVSLKHRFDDYFEEILLLAGRATAHHVSEAAWAALDLLEPMLKDVDAAGPDSFVDACFYLYNLLTTGKASGAQLERICRLSADMLACADAGEDAQAHAAKMLELVILDQGETAAAAVPAIIEHVVRRLEQPTDTEELKNQLTVVVLAAVFRLPNVTLPLITAHGPALLQSVFASIKELRGIHDRRVAVLALCQVVRASPVETGIPAAAMPAIVALLDDLQAAHKAKLKAEQAEAEDYDEDDDENEEEEMDEEDEDDGTGAKKGGRRRNRSAMMSGSEEAADAEDVASDAGSGIDIDEDEDDDDDDEDAELEDDEWPETELEEFETWLDREEASHIDEYVEVADLLSGAQSETGAAPIAPGLREALQKALNGDDQRKLTSLLGDIEKRRAAVRSKMIQNRGGYSFAGSLNVPTSFNFGPSTPPTSPP